MKVFFILFLLPIAVFAQELPCGTDVTPAQRDYLSSTRQFRNQYKLSGITHRVPVQPYIARRADSTGGLAESDFLKELDSVNAFYMNAEIEFYICSSIEILYSDDLYDYDRFEDIDPLPFRPDVINIYFFNTVSSGGSSVCGYSYLPPSQDEVVISNLCATNGSTLAHELGHYFSLYHTHGKTNSGTTDELVDESNCAFAGDDICDTPADPNLSGKVDNDCIYTGTDTDDNGDPFLPQVENVMSYSRKKCRNKFTAEQYERIAISLELDRSYLCCGDPVADFGYASDGYTATFSDSSLNAMSYEWNFGDGGTSVEKDPVHIYPAPGLYAVTLAVSNGCGDHFTNQAVNILPDQVQTATAGFAIFPNPAKDMIRIAVTGVEGPCKTELFNALGQQIRSIDLYPSVSGKEQVYELKLDQSVKPGIYLVKVSFGNNVYSGTVHIQH